MWRVLFFSSSFICICPKHLFVIINNDIPWYHDDKLEKKKRNALKQQLRESYDLSLSWDFHILEWHDLSLLQKHSLCLSKAVQWPKKEWVVNSLGKYKKIILKKTCIAIHVALHCFNLFRLWKNLLVSCKFDLLALSFNLPRTIYRQCSVVSLSMHFS